MPKVLVSLYFAKRKQAKPVEAKFIYRVLHAGIEFKLKISDKLYATWNKIFCLLL